MSIYRTRRDKNNPYVMVNKAWVENPDLSAKAKGVLLFLLSKPDDWHVRESEIISSMRDGRDSIRAAIKELVASGHIVRAQSKSSLGKFSEALYDVIEWPTSCSYILVQSGFPSTEKPSTGEVSANSQFSDTDRLQKLMDQAKADRKQ